METKYTEYKYPNDERQWVKISNVWSRKSIGHILDSENNDTLLFALREKCIIYLFDEFGNELKEVTEDLLDIIDVRLPVWLSETIIEHIDFLLKSLQKEE